MHVAANAGNVTAVLQLLNKGAGINVKDLNGRTPVYKAAYERKSQTVRVLLRHGADVNDDSVLKIAVERKAQFVTKAILEHLAMIDIKGGRVNECNVKLIEGREYLKQYYEDCKKELQLMKKTKFYNSISFFHVLANDKKTVSGYMRNAELVQSFIRSDYIKDFFIYKHTLQDKFDAAMERKNFLADAARLLSNVLLINDQHHPIVQSVAQYLQTGDLLALSV